MRLLGELAGLYGDGTVRSRSARTCSSVVRTADVALYARRPRLALGRGDAHTIANVTSCPGAEACRLAVTQSRGLGKVLSDHLAARPDHVAAAGDLDVKISGCPNGCGQHHVAGLGFQGSARRVGGKAAPQYFVMVGGGVHDGGARFARLAPGRPGVPRRSTVCSTSRRSLGRDRPPTLGAEVRPAETSRRPRDPRLREAKVEDSWIWALRRVPGLGSESTALGDAQPVRPALNDDEWAISAGGMGGYEM
jgi:sulfite reductase (NADPH) hemoprotein beta-component